MGYQTCPKCNGSNSKTFERCTCVRGGIPDKGCVICKGSGRAPCFSCDGKGTVYVGNRP